MKRVVLLFIMNLVLFFVMAIGEKGEVIDKIVVKIDNFIITKYQIQKAATELQKMAMMSGQYLSDKEAYNMAKDNLINDYLMKTYAKKNDMTMDDELIKKSVDVRFNQIKANFPDEITFSNELQKAGLTTFSFKEQLEKQIRQQLLYSMIVSQEIKPKIDITELDIRKYFDEHKDEFNKQSSEFDISQLVLPYKPSKASIDNAYTKIDSILKEIKSGKSFEEMAKEYSEDLGSAKYGGDLGYFGRGTMVKEFENAAFSLKNIGDISGVIRTQYGFHILKLLGKKNGQVRVAHILIKLNVTDEDKERIHKLAVAIVDSVNNGLQSFKYFLDKYGKGYAGNGHLGKMSASDLSPDIVSELQKIEEYKCTNPIARETGYTIIYVNKIFVHSVDYDMVKENIKDFLTQKKIETELKKWLDKQRKENYVEVME